MAREKIDDTGNAHSTDDDSGEPASKPATSRNRADSGTAATATRTRAVMQRRHMRIALVMSLAIGVEIAAAVALVVAGLLPWEWGERLWGQTGALPLVVQVAVGLVVLILAVLWWRRGEKLPTSLRLLLLVPAAVLVVLPLAAIWQVEPGGRGAGGLVAGFAAVLLCAATLTWLLALKRLRVLFPFGLAAARRRGYGNVAAVRRAQLIAAPAAAVGGVALVAGSLLVAPGWVSTVDAETASPLTLTGAPSTVTGEPAWRLDVPAAPDSFPTSVWATSSGLLVEELTGIQLVDPRSGESRWHWRDQAYRRISGVLTGGDTVVLGLRHEASADGRDRVVALDVGSGELRWERFDEPLVTAMAFAAWGSEQGDWLVVPEQTAPAGVGGVGSVRLWGLDATDGSTRWKVGPGENCVLSGVSADAGDVVVTTEQCSGTAATDNGDADGDPADGDPADDGSGEQGGSGGQQPDPAPAAGCRVNGLDPATGEPDWTWPPADRFASDCTVTSRPGLVLISDQGLGQRTTTALDATTGETRWQVTDDDEDGVAGLRDPALVGGDLAGTEARGGGQPGELIIRDAATGEVRDRVALPDGQPVQVIDSGEANATVTLYRPQTNELVLIDVAVDTGEVAAEAVVADGIRGGTLTRATLTSGPETLAMATLYGIGEAPGPEDFQIRVHGW